MEKISKVSVLCMALCFMTSALYGGPTKKILCTTFPVYQITRNVAAGFGGAQVDLMLPAQLGCPHDYALTPQDMQKIKSADILVINGLGLEEFLGAPIEKANPKIVIIDSSQGIKETMSYRDNDAAEHEHDAHKKQDEHNHNHTGVNPHLFASPRMTGRLVLNIAVGLSRTFPAGGEIFTNNARAYAAKMDALAGKFYDAGKKLKNNRIVTQHGVFDYLARDMGLELIAVVQAHPGQEPAAAEMLEIVRAIRQKKAGAVFVEPQYPQKTGQTIAREAGVPLEVLDPGATGPEASSPDYYEAVMNKNLETLQKTLGVK